MSIVTASDVEVELAMFAKGVLCTLVESGVIDLLQNSFINELKSVIDAGKLDAEHCTSSDKILSLKRGFTYSVDDDDVRINVVCDSCANHDEISCNERKNCCGQTMTVQSVDVYLSCDSVRLSEG